VCQCSGLVLFLMPILKDFLLLRDFQFFYTGSLEWVMQHGLECHDKLVQGILQCLESGYPVLAISDVSCLYV